MCEVHLFRGEATVGHGNSLGYKPGGRHPVIVFSRQPVGSDHDFALATQRAEGGGLLDVTLHRGGTLRVESINSKSVQFGVAYERALSHGFGVIVYSEAVEVDAKSADLPSDA
jgi:hypothetical protein